MPSLGVRAPSSWKGLSHVASDAGMEDFLSKPFQVTDLQDRLETAAALIKALKGLKHAARAQVFSQRMAETAPHWPIV